MRVVFYRDAAEQWRWRLVAGNGRIVADSSEGYESVAGAQHAFDTIKAALARGEGEYVHAEGT